MDLNFTRSFFLCFFIVLSVYSNNGLLSEEQLSQLKEFQNDAVYLQEFPFDFYVPKRMPNRGLFYIDPISDGIKNLISQGVDEWESENSRAIASSIIPGTIVLDIGAHIGTHTVTMSRVVEDGLVLAFEPQKKICRELEMNLSLNNCQNAIVVRCALGKENQTAYLGSPIEGNEGARFISNYDRSEEIEVRTLDSFNLNNVSFIKIDCENTEQEVLLGAQETIERNKPVILIEIQGNQVKAREDGVNQDVQTNKTIRLLQKMGYTVKHLSCCDYLAKIKK